MVGENTYCTVKGVDCDSLQFCSQIYPHTLLSKNWLFENKISKATFVNDPLVRWGEWKVVM